MQSEVHYFSVKRQHTASCSQHTTNTPGCSPKWSSNNLWLIWVSLSLSGLVLHGRRLPQPNSAHHWTHSWAVALPRSITTNHLQQRHWDLLPLPKQFTFPSASIAGNSTINGPQTAASVTRVYLKWLWREKVPWMVHQRAEDVAACRCQSFSTAHVRTGERYQRWRNAGGCAQLRLQRKLLPFRNCFMPYPGAQALWEHQMELKQQKTHWIVYWEQLQVILGRDCPTGVLAWAGPVLCTTSTEEPLIHGAPYGNDDALFLPVVMALGILLKFCPEKHICSHPKVDKALHIFVQHLITTGNIGMMLQRHKNTCNKKLLKLIRKQQNSNIKMTKNG